MMPAPVIGISGKKSLRCGRPNKIYIYGDDLDTATASPVTVDLESTDYNWTPAHIVVTAADRKKNWIVVRSQPDPKRRRRNRDYGDLTITVTFPDGTATPPEDQLTVDDLEYEAQARKVKKRRRTKKK